MAYNRKNILLKIIDIQNLTLEHTKKGVSKKFIYYNYIYPNYRISMATYYSYLAENAKGKLKKLDEADNNNIQ